LSLPRILRDLGGNLGFGAGLRYTLNGHSGISGWYEARLFMRADGGGMLKIFFSFDHWGNHTGEQTQTIMLTSEACRFGGKRWFMLCPALGVRCLKLLLPNGASRFGSRRAYRLSYDSTRQDLISRRHRRLERLFARLALPHRGLGMTVPTRPKGMHWRTFEGLVERIREAESDVHEAFSIGTAHLLKRKPVRHAPRRHKRRISQEI
jgi:hypothetical protein